ncbi:MAG: FliH/SctL family protein [Desulfobacterales bacterium]|nr:FliH/SctL family protein [Desulfobacterales bacterium]MDJ0882586.1 FliH/SctL family protein [Desulfobacterales bacterium]
MRKIIKSSNASRTNTFRLHYFPNIPARGEQTERARSENGAFAPSAPVPGQNPGVHLQPGVGNAAGEPGFGGDDRQQLEDTAKKAYAEGFAQGEADAKALAAQQTAPLLAALENVIAELTDTRQKLQQQIESEVVDLALHVGRKIVGQALEITPELVADIVQAAVQKVEDPEKITIRLNPTDIRHIQSTPGRTILEGRAERIQFEEDEGIEAGGCLVQTEYGEIDARIENQFRAIEEAFRSETMGLASQD